MMKKILNVLFVLSTCFFLVACGSSTPESVAESFVKNIYDDSIDDALKLIHIPEKDKAPGVDNMLRGKLEMQIEANKQSIKQHGGISSITASPANLQGEDRASVQVIVTFKDNETDNNSVKLIKVDGDWKISL